jgi:hypothetical protein
MVHHTPPFSRCSRSNLTHCTASAFRIESTRDQQSPYLDAYDVTPAASNNCPGGGGEHWAKAWLSRIHKLRFPQYKASSDARNLSIAEGRAQLRPMQGRFGSGGRFTLAGETRDSTEGARRLPMRKPPNAWWCRRRATAGANWSTRRSNILPLLVRPICTVGASVEMNQTLQEWLHYLSGIFLSSTNGMRRSSCDEARRNKAHTLTARETSPP